MRLLTILIGIGLAVVLAAARGDAPDWVDLSAGDYACGMDVAADAAGNLYVAGGFSGTVRFGEHELTGGGARRNANDLFLVSYDPAGRVRWAVQGRGEGDDWGLFLAAGRSGIFLAGFAGGTLELGEIGRASCRERVCLYV